MTPTPEQVAAVCPPGFYVWAYQLWPGEPPPYAPPADSGTTGVA